MVRTDGGLIRGVLEAIAASDRNGRGPDRAGRYFTVLITAP
jgi:hypothetical protein